MSTYSDNATVRKLVDVVLTNIGGFPSIESVDPPRALATTKGSIAVLFENNDHITSGILTYESGKVGIRWFSDRERDLILADKTEYLKISYELAPFDTVHGCCTSVFTFTE